VIWSLTYYNPRHINIEKVTTPCTTDLQKLKFTNCYQIDRLRWELYNGMWRGADGKCRYPEGLVRRSMVHARQSTSGLYRGIFHLQNVFYCACIRCSLVLFVVFFNIMFCESQLINQNNATTFCIIRNIYCSARHFNSLHQNVHTEAPIN
jgi:hypothetical protein